jgi:ABC-type antimicrobial peptide transport system permease subunit
MIEIFFSTRSYRHAICFSVMNHVTNFRVVLSKTNVTGVIYALNFSSILKSQTENETGEIDLITVFIYKVSFQ